MTAPFHDDDPHGPWAAVAVVCVVIIAMLVVFAAVAG